MTKVWSNCSVSMRKVVITSILEGFDQRNHFFLRGWSSFKFNSFGLALGTNLKFYTSVEKGLKLKVRKFLGVVPTFGEVTGEKLVEGSFYPFTSQIGLILLLCQMHFYVLFYKILYWWLGLFLRSCHNV